MIAFLKGDFVFRSPAQLIINVNGVGYDVNISLNTFSRISNLTNGLVHTYLHVTENGHTLFGFAQEEEKELFLKLITVSGIGASTARMMLSGMKPDEIVAAIVNGNVKQLETIKGIGKKTAERLIVELRDKLGKMPLGAAIATPLNNMVEEDALYALISLGIARNIAENAIQKQMQKFAGAGCTAEELIKQVLKNL